MNWEHVTVGELGSALQEVEWRQWPRPLAEFLQPSRFTLPRSGKKLAGRAKNNVYYYCINYALIMLCTGLVLMLRRPTALFGHLLGALAVLTLNNTFATSLSETLMLRLRRINVRLAQNLAAGSRNPGYPDGSRTRQRVLGIHRGYVSATLGITEALLLWRSHSVILLLTSIVIGILLVGVHATFRSPNLKARLGSAREEFRALWRGQQQQEAVIDYTL